MGKPWSAAALVAWSCWLGGCSLVVDFDDSVPVEPGFGGEGGDAGSGSLGVETGGTGGASGSSGHGGEAGSEL